MRKYLFLLGIIFLVLAYAYYKMYVLPTSMQIGDTAPNFKCTSGFELKSLEDHYIFLDFWGSWCGPCRKQNPQWVKLYNSYKDADFTKASGFEIVSVALEENSSSWKQAIEADGLNWPYQCIELDRMQSEIAELYDVQSLPTTFLINPNGKIVGINMTKGEIERFLQQKMTD